MRAVVVKNLAPAGSDIGAAIEVRDVPLPEPGLGEVRVKVSGAAVNPSDLYVVHGFLPEAKERFERGRPLGLGSDVSGIVDKVGPGVKSPIRGTPVVGYHFSFTDENRGYGSLAEHVVVAADLLAAAPTGIDLVAAASIPMNSITADTAVNLLKPNDGDRLLVTGAAGAVGGYAIALAARAGWTVTGLARQSDAEFLERAGAARFVTEFPANRAFDAVIDCLKLGARALESVRDRGQFVGLAPGMEPPSVRGINVVAVRALPCGKHLAEMLELAGQGVLETRVAGRVPIEEARRAYRLLQEGGHRGRWIVTP